MFSVSAAAANVQMFGKRLNVQAKMSIYVSRQKTSDSSQTGAFKIFDVLLKITAGANRVLCLFYIFYLFFLFLLFANTVLLLWL